jgi:hypothetical protein
MSAALPPTHSTRALRLMMHAQSPPAHRLPSSQQSRRRLAVPVIASVPRQHLLLQVLQRLGSRPRGLHLRLRLEGLLAHRGKLRRQHLRARHHGEGLLLLGVLLGT